VTGRAAAAVDYQIWGREPAGGLTVWRHGSQWRVRSPVARHMRKGDVMGKEARIGLLLGACACLVAVLVDWVVEELH